LIINFIPGIKLQGIDYPLLATLPWHAFSILSLSQLHLRIAPGKNNVIVFPGEFKSILLPMCLIRASLAVTASLLAALVVSTNVKRLIA